MRRPLVAGNWKLHGTVGDVTARVEAIAGGIGGLANVEWSVFPAFVHLPLALEHAAGGPLLVGAQDVSEAPQGAFTGEVSAPMLAEIGCRQVIVGHSECRARHAETDERVARKFVAARESGLVPIVCVGESLDERDRGQAEAVVRGQLQAVLELAGTTGFAGGVIAYEPIWAIGTGRTASPAQAQEIHAVLRAGLAECDAGLAAQTRIVYGGSVKAANAADLFAEADIDGALVGGASLDAEEFMAIGRAAAAQRG